MTTYTVKKSWIMGRYHILKACAEGKTKFFAYVRSTGRRAGVFPSLAAALQFVKGKG